MIMAMELWAVVLALLAHCDNAVAFASVVVRVMMLSMKMMSSRPLHSTMMMMSMRTMMMMRMRMLFLIISPAVDLCYH